MSERLKVEGRLLEKKEQVGLLKLKIFGLVESLRNLLDPFEEIEDLKADVAASQALDLASQQILYKECLADIKALKKAAGKD